MTRPLVLIDLDAADVATIRGRLLEIAARENLTYGDIAALLDVSRSAVKNLLGGAGRASDDLLRDLILAFPGIADGLPVEIRHR